MTTEYSGFKVGGFVSPLTAATTNSLLQDADPARFVTLAYYKAVLQIHLGARFDAEVANAGLPGMVGAITTLAIPCDPLPYLTQAQLAPPFLAVYVPSETTSEKTRNWYHLEETWKVLWVMPPLSLAQYIQLEPFLRAVTKVLVDRTEQGHDPAYLSDAEVWDLAGIEQIKVEHARYGTIQGLKSELFFPAVELDLKVFERKMSTPGLTTFLGMDTSLQTTDADGSNAVDVAQLSQDLP